MPSSVIASFTYNPDTLVLRITFVSGLIYAYYDVPPVIYEEMKHVKSKGTYFNRRVKGHYRFKRKL
ncbi:KTSC domain-containing protein [Olivibacter domesticus]|uniref:KTSC domain-containing protein n=1 Tax=Olivibacter domesticus TaxID=407022 RepID=A0A1H7L565_OLID1|nr:KTSC domain-containing protein [Olivibacter domesticus]SEK93836.1 KTSC domain-containing protein [Olivibacter domesticus]